MAHQTAPDLSHLSGTEVERVADALVSGQVRAILEHRKDIVELDASDVRKITDLASGSRFNCGGFGCG